MIRNVGILVLNDLAIAFKNKTVYLLVLIPLLISVSLKLVDNSDGTLPKSRIGLIRGGHYPLAMVPSIQAAQSSFALDWVANEEQGRISLKDKKLDGLLFPSDAMPNSARLLVLRRETLRTVAIIENLSALQRVADGNHGNWVAEVTSLESGGVQKESLPTWVLMMMLLVGFIVIPTQVAEEKEKKLLLGLLQTPMSEKEWLLAKLFLGMILTLGSILLLHLIGWISCPSWLSYLSILFVGSLYFSSAGILLGFLCRTQASARALGVVFYLPHLLPSALSDFSQKMRAVAHFIPSYQFYEPIKSILFEGGGASRFPFEVGYLALAALASCAASLFLIRKRWLM